MCRHGILLAFSLWGTWAFACVLDDSPAYLWWQRLNKVWEITDQKRRQWFIFYFNNSSRQRRGQRNGTTNLNSTHAQYPPYTEYLNFSYTSKASFGIPVRKRLFKGSTFGTTPNFNLICITISFLKSALCIQHGNTVSPNHIASISLSTETKRTLWNEAIWSNNP